MAATYTPSLNITMLDPGAYSINGTDASKTDIIGTASWGPIDTPVPASDYAGASLTFGDMKARKYDMMTVLNEAVANGGNSFTLTRVADGTQTFASVNATVMVANVATTGAIVTALYTGSDGAKVSVGFTPGAKANTVTAIVSKVGQQAELFPLLPATNFWQAFVDAVNTGANVQRGPSNFVRAVKGTAVPAPPASTFNLVGGSDGATTITSATLVGSDGAVKKGMYATRDTGGQICVLADADDGTQWTIQAAFGEAAYKLMVLTGPAGSPIANTVAAATTAGLDSNRAVLLHGDWLTIQDNINNVARKVSPQGFYAGRRASLQPHQSVLNKPMAGIVTSERVASAAPYADAELEALGAAGIEVITNPIQRGPAWGAKIGLNTSSNTNEYTDAWSTMTNYIATSLKGSMGIYVGENINEDTFNNVTATVSSFLSGMMGQGMLEKKASGALPFLVQCDARNNPQTRTALGFLQCDVQVTYQGIVRIFNITVEGGANVVITDQNAPQ